MDTEPGNPIAGKRHIETLLQRRDHLKKVAFERLLQGQEVGFQLREIGAINSVVNELLALRASQPAPIEDESAAYPIEVDTLTADEAMAMIFPQKDYLIEVKAAKRIRFRPTSEIRITRTTSCKMDVVNIGLWTSNGKDDAWRGMGRFRVPVKGFSVLVQELINLEIEP